MMAPAWLLFVAFILLMLALDLGVFNRRPHAINPREALAWTAFWVALALTFAPVVHWLYEHGHTGLAGARALDTDGATASVQYLTAYIIEKSLSLDNIFIIAIIFAYFRIPLQFQHRVLFWGVIGALGMRGALIALGATLMRHLAWMAYVFGALLLFTAFRLLMTRHDTIQPEKNMFVRLARRLFPVCDDVEHGMLLVRQNGVIMATPLLLVLVLVEATDLLFAVDSIPAALAVTNDPFLIFTSNAFAMLGMRSLYFALAGLMNRFRYFKLSLVFVLAFVGVKMFISHHHAIPTHVSLFVVLGLLGVGLIASIWRGSMDPKPLESPLSDDLAYLTQLTLQQAKRIIVIVVGSTLLLSGAAMLVLPGPGIVVILMGLSLLATQFVWARWLLQRVRNSALSVRDSILGPREEDKAPPAPPDV